MHSLVTFARRVAFAAVLAVAATAPVTVVLSMLAPAVAEAAVASSIAVKGNQRIEAATIKTYLTIKPGKSYTAEDVDNSVKALYGTSLFSDVSIVQQGSVLVVTVAESPVINSIVFEGNKKIKSSVLITIITLKTRGVLTDAKLQTDISRIKDYYSTNGRSQAYVTAKITDLGENRVDVRFLIDEGDKTGVAAITFVGQRRLLLVAAEPHHPDATDELAELAQPKGRLQPGQAAGGRGRTEDVLPVARLCRLPGA